MKHLPLTIKSSFAVKIKTENKKGALKRAPFDLFKERLVLATTTAIAVAMTTVTMTAATASTFFTV